MNYRNENATPRDRYGYGVFSENTNDDHSHGQCSNSVGQSAAEHTVNRPCHCNHYHERTVRRNNKVTNVKGICGSDNGYLQRSAPIAMVYSPMQQWKELYDPCTALTNGTIFKELDLPFYPTPCRRKEQCQCQYR